MESGKAKFFIKFNLTDENANSLIHKGEIFANCPLYYIYESEYKCVGGIGDKQEGLLLGCIRSGANLPLFCMYEVNENNVVYKNEKCYVRIDKHMIKYFSNGDNNCFVAINRDYFISKIKSFQHFYNARLDRVRYYHPSLFEQVGLLNDKTAERLTIKSPDYAYQQEVRLIIDDPFPALHVDKSKKMVYFKNNDFYEYKGRTYKIGSLEGYAIKLNNGDLTEIDDVGFGFEYSLVKEFVEKHI